MTARGPRLFVGVSLGRLFWGPFRLGVGLILFPHRRRRHHR